ncbi:hypothetical protein KIW84_045736 [Lathyrus oleraceus]|uniref:Uncharacterized protein n=1 Tax=Pisum sativum TaxID=3888 RepID=A0A9D5AXL6_PEA|nr:hypothetical protein KIW84_045736 [Pisum sativum]
MFSRKFCNCESWLAEQFGVKNFNSLGYGDLLSFLENNTDRLPRDLLKLLGGGMCENSSIKACISSNELVSLLSQTISRTPTPRASILGRESFIYVLRPRVHEEVAMIHLVDDKFGEPESRFEFRAYIGEVWYLDLVVQAMPPPATDSGAAEKI